MVILRFFAVFHRHRPRNVSVEAIGDNVSIRVGLHGIFACLHIGSMSRRHIIIWHIHTLELLFDHHCSSALKMEACDLARLNIEGRKRNF